MRRLARYLFALAAALSLLLCVAAFALWARSYGGSDRLGWQNAGGWRWLASRQGTFAVELLFADWSRNPASWHGPRYSRNPVGLWDLMPIETFTVPDPRERIAGWQSGRLMYHYRRRADGVVYLNASAPSWSIVLTTAALPAAWNAARLRAARIRRNCATRDGRCRRCDYDLRATPERCPECGAVPL